MLHVASHRLALMSKVPDHHHTFNAPPYVLLRHLVRLIEEEEDTTNIQMAAGTFCDFIRSVLILLYILTTIGSNTSSFPLRLANTRS